MVGEPLNNVKGGAGGSGKSRTAPLSVTLVDFSTRSKAILQEESQHLISEAVEQCGNDDVDATYDKLTGHSTTVNLFPELHKSDKLHIYILALWCMPMISCQDLELSGGRVSSFLKCYHCTSCLLNSWCQEELKKIPQACACRLPPLKVTCLK